MYTRNGCREAAYLRAAPRRTPPRWYSVPADGLECVWASSPRRHTGARHHGARCGAASGVWQLSGTGPTVGGKDSFCGRIGSCDTLCVGPNSDIRGFLDAGNTAALASYSVHFTEPCIAGELMLGKRAEMMGAYIAAGFGCFFGLFAVMCLCSRLRNWLRRKNSYRMWLARNGTQQPQFPGPQSFMMPAQNGCIR